MLTRFAYRVVSVFFLLGTVTCWCMTLFSIAALVVSGDFQFAFYGVWLGILAYLLAGARRDAWRAGRYDPLYD